MNDLCVLRIYSSKGDRETPKQQEEKYCVTFFFSQVNKIWRFLLRGWHGRPTSGTDIITCFLVSHLTYGIYLTVTNGCSSTNKYVHITTSKEETKGAFYPTEELYIS